MGIDSPSVGQARQPEGLLVLLGAGGDQRHRIAGPTTIGRAREADLQVGGPLASRIHARVRPVSGVGIVLEDCGSKDGTLVGDRRVALAVLRDGDVIRIGDARLRFEATGPARAHGPAVAVADTASHVERSTPACVPDGFPDPADDTADATPLTTRYARLRAVHTLARALAAAPDRDARCARTVEAAFEGCAAERGALLLYPPEGGAAVPHAALTRHGDAGVVVSRTIVEEAARTRCAVLALDTQRDPRFGAAESVHVQGIRSALCAPLLHAGRLLGVLYLDTAAAHAFDGDDLELACALASFAALALAGGEAPTPGAGAGADTPGPAAGPRVLVVDDEPLVRELVRRMLEPHGYRVEEAADGAEALARAGAGRPDWDLVVTDVVMPRLTGAELARELRSRWPGMRVLYMSGNAGLDPVGAGVEGTLLWKPFREAELLAAVRAVLGTG